MEQRIEQLSMDWFLMEPALLRVLQHHHVKANDEMLCAMRCGKMRIEYNPKLCEPLSDKAFAEMLAIECIRILLKHPYERQPKDCSPKSILMGSNCVVADNYKLKEVKLTSPTRLGLKTGECFEYYVREIEKKSQQQEQESGGESDELDRSGQAAADQTELWEESAMAEAEVNEIIHSLEASNTWGSLHGKLASQIVASTKAKIDYRKVIQSFRQEVLSSKRHLTRMRPNRRSGFENMGSVYDLSSRLLIAVDVSGSVSDELLADFFGVAHRFFKYGIEAIDVIQFDAEISGDPIPLKKAMKGGKINIEGRGGTSFQPVIDFVAQQKGYYQGLIICTDGYAPHPELPPFFHTPILWVVGTEEDYNNGKEWMSQMGKVCLIKKS
ncbi:MAG: VWA-like domain-containing protein [Bacteroidales bacterium]|nr:VWA-like domain-containing protein [Bacteroidales bacterium]